MERRAGAEYIGASMKAVEYRLRAPPASRKASARHAEIKLRYGRAARRTTGGGGVRLGELRRLFERRLVPKIEIESRIADLGDLVAWSAAQLGQAVELCWVEQLELGIRTVRCTDKTAAEISDFYRGLKRERDRMYKRQKRAAAAAPPKGLSDRAQDLLGIIERHWIARSELVKAAAALASFQRRGRAIDADALLQAVRRAISELQEAQLVEVDDETFNERGQRITTVRLHV